MFGFDDSSDEKKLRILEAYTKFKETLNNFERPNGEKNSPAKTCSDLKVSYPDKPSGEYWVDPNAGSPRDAILVYCDMEKMATCIQPKPSASDEMSVESTEREVWFSDIPTGGFSFTYKADSNQIGFLQMLSSKATQNITYHCHNSLAFYSAKKDHHRKALTLLGWNDLEIRHRGKFSYEVPVDNCQFEKKEWAFSIISMKDSKPTRLPIVDVNIKDIGTERQKFKLEIGQVCFS